MRLENSIGLVVVLLISVVLPRAAFTEPISAAGEIGLIPLDSFDHAENWKPIWQFCDPEVIYTANCTPDDDSGVAGKLEYRILKNRGYVGLAAVRPMLLPGKPERLKIRVYGDGTSNSIVLRIVDAGGETHHVNTGAVTSLGWQEVDVPIDQPEHLSFGGDQNHVLDYPLYFSQILIDRLPEGQEGTIFFADLACVSVVQMHESWSAQLSVRNPYNVLDLDESLSALLEVRSYLAPKREIGVVWKVVTPDGTVVHQEAFPLSVGLHPCRIEIAVPVLEAGFYWLRAETVLDNLRKSVEEPIGLIRKSLWPRPVNQDAFFCINVHDRYTSRELPVLSWAQVGAIR
ncbi:MAG TPA: hypothetical protein PKH07_13445, partial [bacterium]|nr:hypothetical protein [bacterium]